MPFPRPGLLTIVIVTGIATTLDGRQGDALVSLGGSYLLFPLFLDLLLPTGPSVREVQL